MVWCMLEAVGRQQQTKNYPQQAECRFMGICSKVCDLRIRNLKWLDFLPKLLLQHHHSNSLFTSVAFNWVPPNHKYTLIYNTSKTVMDYLALFSLQLMCDFFPHRACGETRVLTQGKRPREAAPRGLTWRYGPSQVCTIKHRSFLAVMLLITLHLQFSAKDRLIHLTCKLGSGFLRKISYHCPHTPPKTWWQYFSQVSWPKPKHERWGSSVSEWRDKNKLCKRRKNHSPTAESLHL